LTKAFGVRRLDLTVYAFKSALILFIFKLFNDDYPLVKDKSILILGRLSSGSLKLLFLTTLVDLPCDCLRQRFMERLLIVLFEGFSNNTKEHPMGYLPIRCSIFKVLPKDYKALWNRKSTLIRAIIGRRLGRNLCSLGPYRYSRRCRRC